MSVGRALTASTFDEVIGSSDVPVLVDFWAEWCHPCKIFDPVLAACSAEDDRFALASVDIDSNQELARRFGVMSAPTLVLLRDGAIVWQSVGARSASRLRDELEPHLAG